MEKCRVLITDKVHELLIIGMKQLGWEVNYDTTVDNEALKSIIHLYQGIIINSKILMDKSMIDLSKNLKFIARLGSGMEIIDVDYARKKGIVPINSPEGNRNAVAEHAMAMLLCLSNNILKADREVRQKIWKREENRGFELKGKTIGIIGLGHTGSSFAKKLANWEVNVISYDKYRKDYPADLDFIKKVNLTDIYTQSDVISLHLPLTKETFHTINKEAIALCKDSVIFVNTSRGAVVDLKAILVGLESKKIGGACLDVFENEKVATFTLEEEEMYGKLYDRQDVVLSPHIAGWTNESLEKIAQITLDRIKNVVLR